MSILVGLFFLAALVFGSLYLGGLILAGIAVVIFKGADLIKRMVGWNGSR